LPTCPYCGVLLKKEPGYRDPETGVWVPIYRCPKCGRTFTEEQLGIYSKSKALIRTIKETGEEYLRILGFAESQRKEILDRIRELREELTKLRMEVRSLERRIREIEKKMGERR